MLRLLVVLLLSNFLVSAPSFAQSQCSALIDQGYLCAMPQSEFTAETSAILSRINGNVQITTGGEFSPASSSVPLGIGDAVVVLESASALLSFGPTCLRPLPAQSSVVIRVADGCVYPSIVETQQFAAPQTNPAGEGLGGAGSSLGLVGGGVLTAAIVAALILSQQGDDGSVSP